MFTIYLFTKENFLNNKDLRKAPRIRQDPRQKSHTTFYCTVYQKAQILLLENVNNTKVKHVYDLSLCHRQHFLRRGTQKST